MSSHSSDSSPWLSIFWVFFSLSHFKISAYFLWCNSFLRLSSSSGVFLPTKWTNCSYGYILLASLYYIHLSPHKIISSSPFSITSNVRSLTLKTALTSFGGLKGFSPEIVDHYDMQSSSRSLSVVSSDMTDEILIFVELAGLIIGRCKADFWTYIYWSF